MIRWNKLRSLAAAAVLAAAIGSAAPGMAVLAAEGTVIGDTVNVRSDASTTSNIIGTAANGDTYELGETKEDDTGATWYQITLSTGETGYIRSDFLNVTEDSSTDGSTENENAGTDATVAEQTDSSSTDTGDYQIIMAPDENGNQTYYLYNNAAKERMKLSDIETMKTQLQEAQSAAQSVSSRYRLILIVMAVIVVILIALCVMLVVRLKDALNGRRSNERDLTQERRNQRRNGEPNVDGLNNLKRSTRAAQAAARRNEPYPSGARRPLDATSPAPARDPRMAQRRPAARPLTGNPSGSANVRESGAPAANGQRVSRPQGTGAASARSYEQRPQQQARPVNTSGNAAERRPARNVAAQQAPESRSGQAPAQESQAQRRPAGNNSSRTPEPQQSDRQAEAQRTARRPQPKNFADDDDLDYDFISLDDK